MVTVRYFEADKSYEIRRKFHTPDHTHPWEDSDVRKTMPAVRAIVDSQTSTGHKASDVLNALRTIHAENNLITDNISTQLVANSRMRTFLKHQQPSPQDSVGCVRIPGPGPISE